MNEPQTSLDLLHGFYMPPNAPIIDIGGGESRLVDHLLDEGYTDVTVLNISAGVLERAKRRLGERATAVQWIVSDITTFRPKRKYAVWHDRATFHFLTTAEQIRTYLDALTLATPAYLVMGAVSENGPEECNGLPVKRYTESALEQQLQEQYQKRECIHEEHTLLCSFERKYPLSARPSQVNWPPPK